MSGEANQALELDELKELCAAATEGPWHQSPDALWHVRTVLENALIPLALKDGEPIADAALDADAAFIAAARSAVPVLIAEVERLTQERDRARDIACHLEQQAAEARRVLLHHLNEDASDDPWLVMDSAARILGDETENQ